MGASYYRIVNDTIAPGRVAESYKINDIQKSAGEAVANSIIDFEGPAFVLGSDENAFIMTPTTEFLDQKNLSEDSWYNLENHYLYQIISKTKSSTESIIVKLKNDSVDNFTVTGALYDNTGGEDDPYGSKVQDFAITLPANSGETAYTINFGVDHLPEADYMLQFNRTNIDGVSIKYDAQGTYQKGMYTSLDNYTYTATGYDIFFEEYYATDMCFDIADSHAVVSGEKVIPIDTHVKISKPSSYGDRRDIVIYTRDGIYEVIEGEVSSKPVSPEDQLKGSDLVIARLLIKSSVGTSSDIIVDQDDSISKNRQRSVLERLRRLEKRQMWDWIYNPPTRVKYAKDSDEITYTNADGHIILRDGSIILSNSGTETFTDSFLTSGNIGSTTLEVDHTYKTVKLPASLSVKTQIFNGDPGPRSRGKYGGNSFYLANTYYTPCASNYGWYRYMSLINKSGDATISDIDLVINGDADHAPTYHCKSLQMFIFDRSTNTLIEKSNVIGIDKIGKTNNGWTRFTFSNTKQWKKGQRLTFTVMGNPTYGCSSGTQKATAYVRMPTYDMNPTYSNVGYTYETIHGAYPFNPQKIDVGFMHHVYNIFTPMTVNGYVRRNQSSGYLISNTITTSAPIQTVTCDLNITVPQETWYELYVSNDNGTNWFKMTGSTYTFQTATSNQFKYKLVFYTNNYNYTPTLFYNVDDGYAIKFSFQLSGGTPPTSGSITTQSFDLDTILKTDCGFGVDNLYSHMEWLRFWAEENGGTISIAVQGSTDNTNWTTYATGLTLSQLYNGSIDFSTYEGDYDANEYNLYCPPETKPFYYPYVRFVISLGRTSGSDPSPSIDKIGLVMILT